MINVYLDDMRRCPKGFVHARNYEECVELLKDCEINVLSLDHDLGVGQPTGMDVVRYMVEHHLYASEIYLHTSSETGKKFMFQHLYTNKPNDVKVYNFPVPDEVLEQIRQSAG